MISFSVDRRTLLNGVLAGLIGLSALPSTAQVGGRQGYDYSTMTRVHFGPHPKITSRKAGIDYKAYAKTLPRFKRAPNLRRALAPAAPGGSVPVNPPAPGAGGPAAPGPGAASLFSFGTDSFGTNSLLSVINAVPGVGAPTAPVIGGNGWQNIGPKSLQPIERFFYGPAPITGRVNALTFDPKNSQIAYLAAPVGGIWKTTDGGATWLPLGDAKFISQSFSCITVEPNNTQHLYAGTGDYDRVDQSGTGLFRSLDGGTTWQQLDIPTQALGGGNGTLVTAFQDHSIKQILIDPNDPTSNTILVAAGRNGDAENDLAGGIFRSTNALRAITPGDSSTYVTFTEVLQADGNCRNLAFNSDNTAIYAAIESVDVGAGIYKSTDGGINWTEVLQTVWWCDVATSKIDRDSVYAIDGLANAIYRSRDAGQNWTDVTSNFPQDLDPLGGQDHNWDFSFQSMYIATSTQYVNPAAVASGGTSPLVDVVYVGLKDVYQSPNAGQTWGATGQIHTGGDVIHSEQHAFAVDPKNPNNILVGNSGGVYKLRYNALDNSNLYTNLNATLTLTQSYDTKFHPTQTNTILSGTRDQGTDYSFGSLFGWRGVTGTVFSSQGDEDIAEFDGNKVALNPSNPLNMYSSQPGYQVGGPAAVMPIYVTDDAWNTFKDISHTASMENPANIQTIALDPNNYQHLYAGTNNLWLYDHVANAWTEELDATAAFKPLTGGYVSAIAPSGITSTYKPFLYLGTSTGDLYLFSPYAMAPTTQSVISPINSSQFVGSVTSIVVSRVNKRRIFVTTDAGEFYRYDDAIGGSAQVDLTGSGLVTDPTHLPPGVPINCVALAAQDDEQVIFVGTDIGVYESTNGGRTWGNISNGINIYGTGPDNVLSFNNGMPNTKVTSLDFNASTNYLSAATFGRGIWRIPIGAQISYPQPIINFTPVLSSYRGAKAGMTATIEVRKAGDPNTAVPVEVHTAVLAANGTFSVPLSVRGHYDIYITIPRFLRRKLADVVTTSQPTLQPIMIIGDIAHPDPRVPPVTTPPTVYPPLLGGDNVIDANDVTLVTNALGQYTNSVLDVDGDGRVTTTDIALVRANQGKRGD